MSPCVALNRLSRVPVLGKESCKCWISGSEAHSLAQEGEQHHLYAAKHLVEVKLGCLELAYFYFNSLLNPFSLYASVSVQFWPCLLPLPYSIWAKDPEGASHTCWNG